MARSDAIWGIDIGQCALKALRCRAHDREDRIIAEAFDYIEYPKILSQPGAEPDELIDEALKQFLSRNTVRGDRVSISVPGQSGLARFIKLPPVEAKKIPDIVRYEARQQIPFDLNDVIWDYQRMGGGSEEEGFALETEIGLFAMKRDAVFRALEPYQRAAVEVDFIQLTPLALYNYLLFDQLHDLPPADEYDPENPPESIVVISLGTDATDLVVTNGYRVWQRSIPLGGNHFTKALTKELKLTFAKAEHLKRNAASAQDPKAVFQAMRPVFNDLLTELQRSIGYFTSIERTAKIGRVVALGNATKLPGLRRYLTQSLGFEVDRVDEFRGLTGSQVLAAPAFKENSLSFAVCYGLVLQGLGKAELKTNLLPKEIVKDRLIRQKKPWAVAAAAVLLLGCAISFATLSSALSGVDAEKWKAAEGMADTTASEASGYCQQTDAAINEFKAIDAIGSNLVANVEGRILWLELLRTINDCLPRDPEGQQPEDISERNELHITNLECQYVEDLSVWFAGVKKWYYPPEKEVSGETRPPEVSGGPGDTSENNPHTANAAPVGNQPQQENSPNDQGGQNEQGEQDQEQGPSGPGWIIKLCGHHYHNFLTAGKPQGAQFVHLTLIKNLHNKKVVLPKSDRETVESVGISELGVSYPVLIDPKKVREVELVDPNAETEAMPGGRLGMAMGGAAGGSPAGAKKSTVKLRQFDFVVHFCWKQTSPTQREEARKRAEEKEDKE